MGSRWGEVGNYKLTTMCDVNNNFTCTCNNNSSGRRHTNTRDQHTHTHSVWLQWSLSVWGNVHAHRQTYVSWTTIWNKIREDWKDWNVCLFSLCFFAVSWEIFISIVARRSISIAAVAVSGLSDDVNNLPHYTYPHAKKTKPKPRW